jgi:toxin YoeB
MKTLAWTPHAWEDYLYWQAHDRAMLRKVNALVQDALRTPFAGLGKPEALRFDLAGAWSRRITAEHRLVYLVDGGQLVILQCRYHY